MPMVAYFVAKDLTACVEATQLNFGSEQKFVLIT